MDILWQQYCAWLVFNFLCLLGGGNNGRETTLGGGGFIFSYPWYVCTVVLCTPWFSMRQVRHICCMVMVFNYACLFQQRHDDYDLFKCALWQFRFLCLFFWYPIIFWYCVVSQQNGLSAAWNYHIDLSSSVHPVFTLSGKYYIRKRKSPYLRIVASREWWIFRRDWDRNFVRLYIYCYFVTSTHLQLNVLILL